MEETKRKVVESDITTQFVPQEKGEIVSKQSLLESEPVSVGLEEDIEYAEWWQRLLCYIIDAVIYIALFALIIFLISRAFIYYNMPVTFLTYLTYGIVGFIIYIMYFVIPESKYGKNTREKNS